MITKEQLAAWKKLRGCGMQSAVGEYTPEEFWALLDEVEKFHALFKAVDEMMAYLGAYGEISPKSELADAVMNALHEIDPK